MGNADSPSGPSSDGAAIELPSEESRADSVLSLLSERYGSDAYSDEAVRAANERISGPVEISEAVSWYVESVLLGRKVSDLQIENGHLRRTIELFGINEACMAISPRGIVLDVNEKMLGISGYSREEVVGQPVKIMNSGFHPKEFWNDFWKTLIEKKVWIGDIRNRRKDGSHFWLHTVVRPILDENGDIRHFSVIREDVTEVEAIRRRHSELMYQKMHPLTGLPTHARLLEALKNAKWTPGFVAIHVERLIEINNAYGYEAGNAILMHVAEILKTLALNIADATVYKLDGTDFCIFTDGPIDALAVDRIESGLFNSEGSYLWNRIPLSFAVGIVASAKNGEEAMENALRALQYSKERKEFVVYDDSLKTGEQYREDIEMASLVRLAIERGWVRSYFQEIVRNRLPLSERLKWLFSIRRGTTSSIENSFDHPERKFESLVRILNPKNSSIVPPWAFLSIAKKTGKLRSLTHVMVEQVVSMMAEHPGYSFSINLSEEDLRTLTTVEFVQEKIESAGIDPSMLTFEVLEELDPAYSERSLEVVRGLKRIGCRIGIDDFGTRFSNFSRLRDYDPDYVKIDMWYVRDIHRNERNRILVETIVGYAHKNGIRVIAEGVETPEEQETVRRIGVDYSQGYLFSRPAPTVGAKA